MSVIVDFQCTIEDDVPEEACFKRWAEAALSQVEEDCELSIRLTDEAESAELNGQYRHKQGPTNVLSFPFESPISIEPVLLGDLVICAPVVEREAVQQNKLSANHWAHMVVHGCLHLLGYDHIEEAEAEEMEALEVKILNSLEIPNPYEIREIPS